MKMGIIKLVYSNCRVAKARGINVDGLSREGGQKTTYKKAARILRLKLGITSFPWKHSEAFL